MRKTIDNIHSYIHKDMMAPRGQVVRVVRENIHFDLKLDGQDSVHAECVKYTEVNPGVIRIEAPTLEYPEIYWAAGCEHLDYYVDPQEDSEDYLDLSDLEDLYRMQSLLIEKGYTIGRIQLNAAWKDHSDLVCASWLHLPESDDELIHILLDRLVPEYRGKHGGDV